MFPCNFKGCDVWPNPFAIMLMLLAMASSGLVLVSSEKFNYQARTSVNIIIKTANEASEIIHNATGALKEIHKDLVESNIGLQVSGNLYSTADKFDSTADNLVNKATKDRQIINNAFKLVIVLTIVTISFNLILLTTLSVFGVLKLWRVLYLLVLMCWLIIVICWLLFGVYLFLNNFSNDVCTSLFNFEENPYSSSPLSYILPCKQLLSAKPVLSKIGGGIYNLFNEVNKNIKNLTMIPNLVYICNPFTAPPEYLYQQENCPPHTVQIGDIPKVLKPYTCFDEDEEKCSYQEFIPSSDYQIIESYARSIQNLLNVYPCMEELIGCELVKDALAQVVFKHCKPLKKFAKMTWLGMLFVAMFMMFLLVLWITIKAHYDDKHSNDNASDSSLQPHAVTENA
ncbi:uncharacterized protein LOC123916693 [Trifolium pratense]|uniref:uncharacterized protein LOC123916693 n=1 Tax=Trifolium pratense TaxID=57577 RepID=UPI001E69384D|nr:uncharacterized protein LOC123916693 [Trifolium pratense]